MSIKPPERAVNRRNPARNKPTASISVRWPVYDELDRLAADSNLSIGMVIESLVEAYTKKESGE